MSTAWAAAAPGTVLRRARSQRGVLLAVTATALVALTVLATCGLLLTAGRRDALDAALAEAASGRTDVVARLAPAPQESDPVAAAGLAADAGAVVADVLAPLPARTSTWTESPLLALPGTVAGAEGEPAFAYLADAPGVQDVARLVDGAWPAAAGEPWQVAVPATTAQALGLRVGDTLTLAASADSGPGAVAATTVRVTGVFVPDAPVGGTSPWDRDLLGGAGVDPDHDRPGTSGRRQSPAAGPFVLPEGSLAAPGPAAGAPSGPGPGTGVGAVSVLARPDAVGASTAALADVARSTPRLRALLSERLAERTTRVVVRTSLPAELTAATTQHRVTGAAVLVGGLVCAALCGAALLLAGRLLAVRRSAERALLLDRGAAAGQVALLAVVEAGALVLVAAVLAVPAALAAYRALTALPVLADAGLRPADAPTGALLGTVACGAVALGVALVAPATRTPGGRRGAARAGRRFARSGGDVLLLALAVLAGLRLRAADGLSDAVRVLAPVLALLAVSALGLRLLPLLARGAERRARGSRGFVLPVAAVDVARRPRAATALLLTVLATAGATFGASWAATWDRSQQEQADAGVAAAVVAADLPGTLLDQGALARSADGSALPATDRATALGTLVGAGSGEAATRLVAVDTTAAELTGRLPAGGTWAGLTAGLAPQTPADAVPVLRDAGGVPLEVTGSASGAVPLSVTPTVVLDDGHGARVAAAGDPVPLDGVTHPLHAVLPGGSDAPGTVHVVAVLLRVTADVPPGDDGAAPADATVTVSWRPAPGSGDGPAGWSGVPTTEASETLEAVAADVDAAGVTASTTVDVTRAGLVPADLVVSGLGRPGSLPVLVSADLARAASLEVGDALDVLAGTATLPARVAGVAPYVPGVPRGPALLADLDALSRAALTQADASALVDRWWLDGTRPAAAAAALRDAGATVTVRAEVAADLRDGPLRVGVLAALGLLVTAAVALALVGAVLHAAGTADDRGPEVARLLALGASPRSVVGVHLVQHAAVDLLAVATGACAGAVVARALAPALTVSDTGAAPVPGALPVWPWPVEAGLLAVVLVGSTVVVLPVVLGLVRRAAAAHLRLGDVE
ncbi:hypothetical protein [Cellulomonas hominis]|uniref:hypothetical protein n=1 Tax=Cellulomonas hominis TaxID=156981 RepID=UPI001B92E060|nr:hypothetical protein [Cellulomonas hominis]VTR77450.1 hypothetical protein CHMI_02219 [Cellulomonas hominis]